MTDSEGLQGNDLDLSKVKVLHSLHPLDNQPGDSSTTVRLGFKWAERGEGTALFLCECADRCSDPNTCGRTPLYVVQDEARNSEGKQVQVEFPWTHEGEAVTTDVWCCDQCKIVGTGAVYDVWAGRFYDIPARLLQFEHEQDAHTYEGLQKSMGKAYPDTFTEASFVTVVLYKRTT